MTIGGSGEVDEGAVCPHLHAMNAPARIVSDPAICHGRPIVAGTRMRVVDILDSLADGAEIDELVADFPYITREDVLACIAYAARAVDHSVVQAVA